MNEITLYEYKEYKNIKSPNNDLKLEPIIEFVNSFIPKYCNLSFNPVIVENARVESCDGLTILLPHSTIISIEELLVNEVASEDYVLDKEIGLIENTATTLWPTARNKITVSYTYGLESIPTDLKIAAYELISYFSKGNFSTTKTSSTGESLTNPAPVLLPKQVRLMLDMHKCL